MYSIGIMKGLPSGINAEKREKQNVKTSALYLPHCAAGAGTRCRRFHGANSSRSPLRLRNNNPLIVSRSVLAARSSFVRAPSPASWRCTPSPPPAGRGARLLPEVASRSNSLRAAEPGRRCRMKGNLRLSPDPQYKPR